MARPPQDIREGRREDHEEQGTLWRERLVEQVMAGDHPGWTPGHFRRVAAMSERLALSDEPAADRDVLSAVAWLHHVETFPANAQPETTLREAAAQAALHLLPETGFPVEKLPTVVQIIREHSFDRRPAGLPEARVFHDADMLDLLGAVGVFRLLTSVGVEDWVSARRAVEEARRYAEEMPHKLVLPTAKRVAVKRATEALAFLDALELETHSLQSL